VSSQSLEHGDDVFDRRIALNLVNGVKNVAFLLAKYSYTLYYLLFYLFWSTRCEHALGFYAASPEKDLYQLIPVISIEYKLILSEILSTCQ